MYPFEKYHIFTKKEQLIILEAFFNGYSIDFHKQKIYHHFKSFKKSMRSLVEINAFELKRKKSYPFNNIYILTDQGIDFVRKAMKI
jgi:hypothetical protein